MKSAEWVEKHKLNMVHVFTVDDLFNLHRGGRVSRATAIVGTLASIKPLLHVDDEGHLVAVGKGPRQEEIPEQSGGYDGKANRELPG